MLHGVECRFKIYKSDVVWLTKAYADQSVAEHVSGAWAERSGLNRPLKVRSHQHCVEQYISGCYHLPCGVPKTWRDRRDRCKPLALLADGPRRGRAEHAGVISAWRTRQRWNWVTFCDPPTQWPKNHVTRRPSWPGDPCQYMTQLCRPTDYVCESVSLWVWGGLFVFATLHVAPAVWALRHVMRLRWATVSNQ